ncbi:MAG: FAD:protein FMN transferase, partial [Actinobacteria bacterium]|nr:FAD:protein FMN transferase [Actinomycetota bacterium]
MSEGETSVSFACFGSTARVYVGGDAAGSRPAPIAARIAKRQLIAVHDRLTRFRPASELCRLNADPRPTVAASPLMRRFAHAAVEAGRLSGGLVDATLLGELEEAGYGSSRAGEPGLGTAAAVDSPAPRRPARPGPGRWREVSVDDERGTVTRPVGVRLDSGGLAKGLAADVVGSALEAHPCYAVDCAGDICIGGSAAVPRKVGVDDPFGGGLLETIEVTRGGVATSGIGRRTWRSGRAETPAHHLLDPATGRPAYTGVVQVTALAPTALEAEIRAKAALLAGPDAAGGWLPHGGV